MTQRRQVLFYIIEEIDAVHCNCFITETIAKWASFELCIVMIDMLPPGVDICVVDINVMILIVSSHLQLPLHNVGDLLESRSFFCCVQPALLHKCVSAIRSVTSGR